MMKKAPSKKDTKVERFSLIDSIDEKRFVISHQTEILTNLKRIQEKGAFLSVYSTSPGNQHFVTIIHHVDEIHHRIVFDSPSNALLNRHFLNHGDMVLTTAIDRVRIQFEISSVRQTFFASTPAYVAKFPSKMTRLQRRDFYRLTIPVTTPISCEISNRNSRWGGYSRYEVYDISVGGLGINGAPLMPIGEIIHNIIVNLPEIGAFSADVIVCHTFWVQLKNGQKVLKTGFRYTNLCDQRHQKIQRYINQITMERRSRETRMEKKKPG